MSAFQDSPPETRRRKWRIALTYALTTPLAAATLAITLAVSVVLLILGYMLVGLIFLGAGLLFYIMIVVGTLRDEDQIRRVLIDELYPERSADLRKLHGKYASTMQMALDDRKSIEKAIQASPEAIQRALADTLEQVGAITDTVFEVAYKAQSLEDSLGPVNEAQERQEVARLRKAIEMTQDDYLRQQYRATLEAKEEMLNNLAGIRNGLERWHAQLQRALTTLDNLYSQVLMIRSAEIRNLTEASDVVSQSLRDQVQELRSTSRAMDEVFSQGG